MTGKFKYTLLLLFFISACLCEAGAREARPLKDTVEYTDAYLDTVQVKKKLKINDYALIGFQYGAGMHKMTFTPKMSQESFIIPEYYGVTFTKYGKMFGQYPYFGFQLGVFYGHEGYKFKEDEETGNISHIEGATQAIYDIVEVPFLSHFHVDFNNFKLMANLGPYAGYRLRIERIGESVKDETRYSFLDTDRRWDYGLQGGAGFALVFAPIEFQVNAMLRYSWGSIYDPDYRSKVSYRFAYPFDIMVTAGIYFQLGKRTGKTSKDLKNEARTIVYGEN